MSIDKGLAPVEGLTVPESRILWCIAAVCYRSGGLSVVCLLRSEERSEATGNVGRRGPGPLLSAPPSPRRVGGAGGADRHLQPRRDRRLRGGRGGGGPGRLHPVPPR